MYGASTLPAEDVEAEDVDGVDGDVEAVVDDHRSPNSGVGHEGSKHLHSSLWPYLLLSFFRRALDLLTMSRGGNEKKRRIPLDRARTLAQVAHHLLRVDRGVAVDLQHVDRLKVIARLGLLNLLHRRRFDVHNRRRLDR